MSFSNSVLFTVLPFFVIVGLYLFVKKKFEFFKKNGTLHMKPNSWLLGNLGEVTTKIHIVDFFRQTYETFKGKDVIAGYYSMFTPTILVLDLETIKNITIKDFNYFSHRGVYVNEEEDPISGHLFSLDGEKWKFLRNKLSPVFTSGKVKMMYHTISDKGAGLVKAIEKASTTGSVEMKEMANRFTIDAISSCAFGIESNTLGKEHPEFVALFKDIYGADGLSMFKNLFLFAFPTFSKFLNLRMFPKKIEDFFFENVGGTMKYREKNGVVRNDFLNMLLQLKNKGSIEGEFSTDSRKLSYNECVAQSLVKFHLQDSKLELILLSLRFIFFFAGADTSSTVIAYAMVELGHHPEIQEKLRKEIFEKTKDSKDQITYDNLQEMTYLNQVVNGNFNFTIFDLNLFVHFFKFFKISKKLYVSFRQLLSHSARQQKITKFLAQCIQ